MTSDPTTDTCAILVFGHTRLDHLRVVLKSLEMQGAIQGVHLWLDGHQNNAALRKKVEAVQQMANGFDVASRTYHTGHMGFRKMVLQALWWATHSYDRIIVLEDDCFPTHDAISAFNVALDKIKTRDDVLTVYGHPFLCESEGVTIGRFQGWGWGALSERLRPVLEQLIQCYSMPEAEYLEFVKVALTPEIRSVIDVTHPRQPTFTLEKFFAWDETLCLLSAMLGYVHMKTHKRTIFNCGLGGNSFNEDGKWGAPPFNMVPFDKVWDYYKK